MGESATVARPLHVIRLAVVHAFTLLQREMGMGVVQDQEERQVEIRTQRKEEGLARAVLVDQIRLLRLLSHLTEALDRVTGVDREELTIEKQCPETLARAG